MDRLNRVCLVVLCAVALLAAGACNPSGEVKTTADTDQLRDASPIENGASVDSGEEMGAGNAVPEVGESSDAKTDEATAESLAGSWVSVMGKVGLGVVENGISDGHRIKFLKQGQALWIKIANGAEVATMDSQWQLNKGKLYLSISVGKAVHEGFSSLAPMGISAQEEQGYSTSLAGNQAADKITLTKKVLDVEFINGLMALRDSNGGVMVYARIQGHEEDHQIDLSGTWEVAGGKLGSGEFIFSDDGTALTADDQQGSVFEAEIRDGIVTGRLDMRLGAGNVALQLTQGGSLAGVVAKSPMLDTLAGIELRRAN